MAIERVNLIHQIREAIIEPETFGDNQDLDARFFRARGDLARRINLSVGEARLGQGEVEMLKAGLVRDFVLVASDLGTFDLAKGHLERLFNHMQVGGGKTERDFLVKGATEFYKVARNVLGPLWARYVDMIFTKGNGNGTYLFAARDATPIYWAAEGLLSPQYRRAYPIEGSNLVHVDLNRWFMGQEDETDDGRKPLPLTHPLMRRFYEQMGFSNGGTVKIIEAGAWGSVANALRTMMPEQAFELYFLFSHMPEYIWGFLNENASQSPEKVFEMINDTIEAVPKAYRRPETLIQQRGKVVADLTDKILESPLIKVWSWAVNQGAYDAGIDFARGKRVNIQRHVNWIQGLSEKSREGKWTGVLPRNTMTWTEGEKWRRNWPWGRIPPLS